MRAMGFEDDNGWLAQLLKSKDFDISKVLDAIHFEGKKWNFGPNFHSVLF